MTVYKSQNQQVLSHLKNKGPLTPLESLRLYGVQRLAARVRDLREAGWRISTEMVHGGKKRWARYWLLSATPNSAKGLFPSEGGEA